MLRHNNNIPGVHTLHRQDNDQGQQQQSRASMVARRIRTRPKAKKKSNRTKKQWYSSATRVVLELQVESLPFLRHVNVVEEHMYARTRDRTSNNVALRQKCTQATGWLCPGHCINQTLTFGRARQGGRNTTHTTIAIFPHGGIHYWFH